METTSTYFTRRARQERSKATDAVSAESRKAHLELALRLVRVAIEPALWVWPESPVVHHQAAAGITEIMGNALAGAFPLPLSGKFESLLEVMETTQF